MLQRTALTSDAIRARFSAAMSAMYREEVPAYGALLDLVAEVNAETLAERADLRERLVATDELARISDERHGAIRLGTAAELAMMRRVFAVMGMVPVGYYDLTEANVPVHSTAFRPVGAESLRRNPFRVFTSLLRMELIADEELRAEAEAVLGRRQIFTPAAVALVERAEAEGGLSEADADRFVAEVLETFRWHDKAIVTAELYEKLHDAHRLVADVVSFRGPHINHLTPRTLDIDKVQARMPLRGIAPKAVVEGPPTRACPILLRQTSFKALDEAVAFRHGGGWVPGRKIVRPAADGSNAADYTDALERTFAAFPDDWEAIRVQGLGYFAWSLTDAAQPGQGELTVDEALARGMIRPDPVVYEDFLPVSAAGIFQSNLGDGAQQEFAASPNQRRFEADLGAEVLNEFDHYAGIEAATLRACLNALI
jgi:uncharacterized glyoxalase superfamily metalloenzyme YdcJ